MSTFATVSVWSAQSAAAFERLRYWRGQTLRSLDFRDQAHFDARRRRLHNRALHGVDGVSFGLGVTKRTGDQTKLDVACGLAYDCYGRELIVQRPRTVGVPAEPAWLVLRMRPATTPSLCCVPFDPGCLPEDARLLDQDAELVWDPIGSTSPVSGVVLAKFTDQGHDTSFRPRYARALTRPRLARGQTVRGNTPWQPWTIDEPDGKGGLRQRVVGVETRIDTSAAGFTQTPCYFARLDSFEWDLATSEFAPAFFPQVADATVDGFTFKLLMVETTRRRYRPSFGTARVTDTTRGVGDRLQVEVDDAAQLQKGDVIALLRPRARSVVRVEHAEGVELTLAAALEQAEVDKTLLAVGNLPRVAKVTAVKPESAAMLAAFTSVKAVKKADVLLRTSDNAVAVVDSVKQGVLTVGQPFAAWKKEDPLSVARLSGAVTVESAVTSADGSKTSLKLKPATHTVNANETIVLLDAQKAPFVAPAKVVFRHDATVDVQPALTAAEIAALKRVAPFAADISIDSLQPKSAGTVVTVETVGPFAVGDVVALAGDSSTVATIDKIRVGSKELSLSGVLPAKPDALLVAANWAGATTVSAVNAGAPVNVVVGRANVVPPDAFVVRREADDFSLPVTVKSVSGAAVTLAAPIPGLARLDTLAVGVFPAITTVLVPQESGDQFQIVEAGALRAGDSVVLLSDEAKPRAVAQVVSASGNTVIVSESLGTLTAGQRVAVIHFRDRLLLTDVDATDATKIEVDRDVPFREEDVVGVLTHYADCSNAGFIESVQGDQVTLGIPGIEHGDGIVDQDWIDGGIVGPAAVMYLSPSQGSFPSQFQPVVRLDATDGLNQPQPAVAHGLDLLRGRQLSSQVLPLLYDPAGRHVAFLPRDPNGPYRYRPETLSLITTFNTDFPRAFATFAQKQNLSVSWIGCQEEFPPPSGCPGQVDDEPCADCRDL